MLFSSLFAQYFVYSPDINAAFDGSSVIVVMDQKTGAINKVHDLNFFGIEIIEIIDLFPVSESAMSRTNIAGFHQILQLRLPKDDKENVLQVVDFLNKLDGVKFAEPNYYPEVSITIPNDPSYLAGQLWGLDRINMPHAWDFGTGSHNVRVGVIDTGIVATHPDLSANVVAGWDFHNNILNSNDTNGHGTHVAGTIGAVGNNGIGVVGVNWNVTMVPLKVHTSGSSTSVNAAVLSVGHAHNTNIHVLNYSVGGFGTSNSVLTAITNYFGIFIWAAGNENLNVDSYLAVPSFNIPNLISVGSTTNTDDRSVFSNYGQNSVYIYAPGSDIRSTHTHISGYNSLSGTSMAAPHVAGVAALLLSIFPNLTSSDLKQYILASGDNITISTSVGTQMVKRLNAYNAIMLATEGIAPYPPRNLTATTFGHSVVLDWMAPLEAGEVIGYRIYQGMNFLEEIDTSFLSFIDWDIPRGRHRYFVSAVYSNDIISTQISVNVAIGYENFVLGTGTNSHSNTETGPTNTNFQSMRGQFVYTQEELNEAGLYGPVEISSLGFFPTGISSYSLPSFNIRLKHTTATSAIAHDNGPFEITHVLSAYTPTQGSWCMIDLPTPFTWNGIDNILFDTAFNRTTNLAAGTVRTIPATNGYRYVRSNTAHQVNTVTSSIYNWKPQLMLSTEGTSEISYLIYPSARNFGNVLIETESSPFTFTITNFGSEDFYIESMEITGFDRFNFSIIDDIDFPVILAMSEILTFDVIFEPLSAGSKTAIISIAHNSGDSPSHVAISGFGTIPNCAISLSEIDFAAIALDKTSDPVVFTISNIGTANLIIHDFLIPNIGNYDQFSLEHSVVLPHTLTPSESIPVEVYFNPTSIGNKIAVIEIEHNAPNTPNYIALSGLGIRPAAMSISPPSYHFAEEMVGVPSETITFTIANTGDAELIISDIYLTDENFILSDLPELPVTLLHTDDMTFDLTFSPIAAGEKTDIIYIVSNASELPNTIEISGDTNVSDTDIVAPVLNAKLIGNFPNPFNPETVIEFIVHDLAEFSQVNININIYNLRGQLVRRLVNGIYTSGQHLVVWDGTDDTGIIVGSGVYFYRMQAGDYSNIKKMILLK
jgi:hypothetical protein